MVLRADALRAGENVSFKKAQICKVIKEIMANRARYTFNEGEVCCESRGTVTYGLRLAFEF